MAAWNRAVHDAVHAELRQGKLPILLGGDHCLGIGSISAVARHCRDTGKKLRVLWLDAHADFNTHALTPTGNIHGMPVACLCGYGPAEITGLSGHHPDIEAAWVRQIGIRSVDPGEKRLVHEAGLEVFDMRYLDEMGMRADAGRARRPGPGHAPACQLRRGFPGPRDRARRGHHRAWGPTYREAQLCMEMIADTGLMRSLDVVELNPAFDVRNKTAELAVDLIESLFGKSTLMRRDA